MSLSALGSATSAAPALAAAEPAWARELGSPMGMPTVRGLPEQPSAADVKKAASQFEAIILRQLLAPSIEPMMNGGLGGTGGGSGGGVYGYMLTDVLAGSLGSAGGLGLGAMLEKQLSPRAPAPDASPDPDSPLPAPLPLRHSPHLPTSAPAP